MGEGAAALSYMCLKDISKKRILLNMHSMHSMHILGGGPAALSYMCLKDTSKKRIAMILLSLLFGNTLMIFSVIFKVFSKRKFNIVLGCSLIVFVTTHQLSPNGCRIEKCQVYFLVCSIR